DAWMSWDLPYALKMVRRLEELEPRWVEEPLMPDRLDGYAELRQHTNIPISGGEHTMTRWGFKSVTEARAMDILQPDIYWTGGISEAVKVAALASAHDLQVMVHGFNNPANLHFSAAMSPSLTPLQENLVQWSPIFQHFLKESDAACRRRLHCSNRAGYGHGVGHGQDRVRDGDHGPGQLIALQSAGVATHLQTSSLPGRRQSRKPAPNVGGGWGWLFVVRSAAVASTWKRGYSCVV
ncbi:MAG: hypothetical protein O3C10_13850, partial [Chloroflexi bacterium]|nr:hypothetical protein [Chloroflexota bacterium]